MILKSNLLATHGIAGHVIVPGLNEIPDDVFEKMKEYTNFLFRLEKKIFTIHQDIKKDEVKTLEEPKVLEEKSLETEAAQEEVKEEKSHKKDRK